MESWLRCPIPLSDPNFADGAWKGASKGPGHGDKGAARKHGRGPREGGRGHPRDQSGPSSLRELVQLWPPVRREADGLEAGGCPPGRGKTQPLVPVLGHVVSVPTEPKVEISTS